MQRIKNVVFILISLALFLSISTVSVMAIDYQEYDNIANNNWQSPDVYTEGTNMFGTINVNSDEDHYIVIMEKTGAANFWVGVPEGVDYDLEVFDSNGNYLDGSYEIGAGKDELIQDLEIPNDLTFIIKVYARNAAYSSTTSKYQLSAKSYPAPDGYEENNSKDKARYIGNTTIYANIHSPYDIDYYSVWLGENSTLNVHLYEIPANEDYDLSIYDADNNLLASSTRSGNTPEDITIGKDVGVNLPSGFYYIRVKPTTNFQSYHIDYYNLSVNVPSYRSADEPWYYSLDDRTNGIDVNGELKFPGSYTPPSGFMAARFYDGPWHNWAKTYVGFTLDSHNVSSILDYNAGLGTHPDAEGHNCYLTFDISSIRNGSTDQMDAYAIKSNLPNPKYDLESDFFGGGGPANEESEVVALGAVEAKYYDITTYWHDYRNGDTDDSGRWECHVGLSKLGISDYNSVVNSGLIQAKIYYGKDGARP